MKAIISFEIECPNENATKEEFQNWIEFNIGKIDSMPVEPLGNFTLKLIDTFADRELIETSEIKIL